MKNINTVDLTPGTLSPVKYVLMFILLILGITSYGQTKEYATVTPSSGAIAVGLGSGSSGVANPGSAANSSEASFATMTSTRVVGGLLGSGDGWLQLKFENNLQPNDWVYIRYSGINQTGLTLGLGSLLGAPSNFIQATLYKNANAGGDGTALGSSANVKFVTDSDGVTYIAVQSPGNVEAFNSVRIRLTFAADVNLLASRTINIHYAYALSNIPDCAPVAFAGDGEASGVGLNLGSLLGASNRVVENPSYAIDNNTSNYSVLKSSLLSVVGSFSQSFYFPASSEANSVLKVRLQLSSAVADVSVLGGYYIRAYNGTTLVLDEELQGGLVNGLNVLNALNSGGIVTIPLDVADPFDRVEIGLQNTLGVSVEADLRIYGVTRSSASCPEPPPALNPLFVPMCANATIVSSLNADDPQFAVDDNFDSYATIRSDAGILIGLGSLSGHLEVDFPDQVPAGKTTYIRIDYDEDILKALVAGSLGDVVRGLLNGLVLGDHYFEVQLKDGASETLNTSSADLFAASNGQVRIVQDKAGRYYIAVKADQPFTNIRLTDRTDATVGLLSSDKYLNVYSVCYDASDDICDEAFATSYDGSGITLGVLQNVLSPTGIENPERAIDDDADTFSQINLGLLSVAGSMSQHIYFNSLSDAQSVFKIKLAIATTETLDVDLLGTYEIIAYNGTTEVYRRSLGGGLLNGTDVLGLLGGGEPGTLTFAPGKVFDHIEIRVNGLVGASAFESAVEVYDVKRFGPAGSGCEDPDFVLPSPTATPFEDPSCDATVVAWENADYAYLAADGNNESYATLTASSGTLLGMGAYNGFLEYEFPTIIPANKTTYIRIDMEDNLLLRLLSGTLGTLGNTVGGLALGDHYFSVEAKTAQTGGTTVLTGSSQEAFDDVTGGDLRIVQDNIGRYYIAVTPNADYQNIRITEHFPALVGLTQDVASMRIFEACMEMGTNNCLPGQFTSFTVSGTNLASLEGAGVTNPDHAISVNSSDYSEISTGTVAIAAQVSQRIYFNQLSTAGDTMQVRLQLDPSSLATVDLLGSYSIVTYNGSAIGETFTLQDGLINNLNLLDLFSSGGVQTLTFQTNTPYDRVDVVAGSLLNVALTPSIRLYEVKRIGAGCPTTTTPSPFENPVCVTEIRASSNADNLANLFDDDFDSYATLNSGANSLLGQLLGGQPNNYTGFVELGFGTPVEANKTAYVRIDFEPTLLNKLVGGSLGGAVADLVDGLLLGNHYFTIQAKNGNTVVLEGGSNDNFGGNNDRIRVVQDKFGRYYIAITPGAEFDAIRITDGTNTALALTDQGNSMNVYGACVDNPLTDCQPVFTTSYDASGLNLNAAGLASSGAGVNNADHAINDNTTDYSEISLGNLAVGQSVRQYFDFRKSALPSEIVNLTLQYGSGALDLNLIGGLEIIAYNGSIPVDTLDVESELINGLNVLGVLNNGAVGVIPYAPGVEYDRISVGLQGVAGVGALPELRVFNVEKDCNTPMFKTWKSYQETSSGTAVANVKGGEEIEYTIHIANTGAVALTNYRVVDTIPEYTTYVAGSGGVLVADSVVFENVTIAVGDTARVSFKVTVNADLTGATVISNVAFVKENENDPGKGTVPPADPADPTAGPDENVPPGTTTDIPVDPISSVSTWKGFSIANGTSATSVSGGETVTYTIYIANTGNQALTGVSISDALPVATTHVSGGTLNGASVDFDGISIPVGDTVTRSFDVLVQDNLTDVTQISNVAVVTAAGIPTSTAPADPTDPMAGPAPGSNPGDPTLIPVDPTDDVVAWKGYSIANGTSTTTVSGGEEVTYTIYIKNESNQDLTGLSVSDALPEGTTYVSGGTLNGNTVEFTGINVAFGQTTSVSFIVNVNADLTDIDVISNVAVVKNDPSDPGTPTVPPADPTDPPAGPDPGATPGDPTEIPVEAIYTIDLSLDGVSNGGNTGQAQAGNVITYTVTITNTGNKDLTNVELVSPIPENTTLNDEGDFTLGGANLELTILTLAVGETQTFTFTVTVDDPLDTGVVPSIDNSVTASNAEVSETATHSMPTDCIELGLANLDLTTSVAQVCIGGSVTLNADLLGAAAGIDPTFIKWYSGFNDNALSGYLGEGASIEVTPTQTGAITYYAIIAGAGFCFDNPPGSVIVTVHALPGTPTITADNATVCEGETITLTATAGADSYRWYRDATLLAENSNILIIDPAALSDAGQYTVIAVNEFDCESAASAPVTIGVTPRATDGDVMVTGNDPVCEGSAVTLTASSALTNPIFYWYNSPSATTPEFTGPSLNLVPNETVTYYVGVSGDGVCESAIADRVSVTVTLNPAPVIVFNEASSYAIEINESVDVPTYNTEVGVTYQWKDQSGADFDGTTFGPFASPGMYVYTLIATNTLSGCQTAANVTIHVFNPDECPPVYTRVYANDASQYDVTKLLFVNLGSVTNPSHAADQDVATFSTLTEVANVAGLLGQTYQNLKWTGSPIAAGTPVTVKLGKTLTAAQLSGGIRVEPIDAAGNTVGISQLVDGDLVNIVAGENIFDFTFVPTNASGQQVPYSGVKVYLSALATVAQSVNLYEAYYHTPGTPDCDEPNGVVDVLSGIERPIGGVGALNGLVNVVDAANAVDGNNGTFAVLNNAVGVNAYTRLEVLYSTPALAGDTLTIRVGKPSSLLTVGLLESFTIQPYLGNTAVGEPIHSDDNLLNISLLAGNEQADVKFIANAPFDRVKILYGGVGGVLDQLQVHEITRTIPAVVVGDNGDNKFEICPGGDIVIPVPDNCTTYLIYDEPTDGNLVDVTTLMPGVRTLYVQTVRFGTCETGERTPIEIDVNEPPVAPIVEDQGVCQTPEEETVYYDVEVLADHTLVYYADATSTTPLSEIPTVNSNIVGTTTVYVSQVSTLTGCESPRVAVSITVNEVLAPDLDELAQTFCEIDAATVADLDITGATGTVLWYTSDAGGTALAPETALTNGSYYASQVV
ncbi:Ig-like domain-containing protein, partial [Sphingobacterium lumbrici]|uniref:Ig-like domain-containing protein n=1 Tax=Sphingobacterium lumbrici TaxID=2559600 RepID=UPI00112A5710